MKSVENKLLKSLKKCGRGTVLFVNRFARLGNADRLHKAMKLLPNEKREDIERDYAIIPNWIREIGKKCYEELSES